MTQGTDGRMGTDDRKRSERAYRFVIRCLASLFRILGVRVQVRGAENLPERGAAVLASNHVGFLDFAFAGYAARDRHRFVRFLAKKDIFEIPFVGWLMRRMRHISVDRASGASAYRHARDALADGQVVGVFPEATISRSWRLKPFRPGAASLAIARDVPLVPAVLWGSQRVYTVDGRRTLRRGTIVTVTIGTPLEQRDGETAAQLTARLHEAMEELLDRAIALYPQQPRHDADRWWLPADAGGTAPDPETAAALDREALARIGVTID